MIDLHIHTNASSDGQHTPLEIFRMAKEKGLQALAFADHNTIAHVEEGLRLAAEFAIEFLPCLELNTFHAGLDLHLLAYFIDPTSPRLQAWLDRLHRKKVEQAEKRVDKLNDLGFRFTRGDLAEFAAGRIPTGVSFLKAILSRPENRNDPRLRPYIDGGRSDSPYMNFYRDYLRGGKPAFVPIEEMETTDAIHFVKELGAIPVLAHPSDTAVEIVDQLVAGGLEGLEVYTPQNSPAEQEAFRRLAEERSLAITAGSDFHGKAIKPDREIGGAPENRYEWVERLKKRRKG
jgi:3',5'-nucleoside bisphosphate phosphatase